MIIRVFSATATGPTALAAFDRTLQVGGVQDTNLLVLSSVIPAGASVVLGAEGGGPHRVGDRLYCVMAAERCIEPGGEAWAGLGWASDSAGRGGVFVEAHGRSDHQVQFELKATLAALMGDRPYLDFGTPSYEVAGISCDGEPVCATVMAIYESADWRALRA